MGEGEQEREGAWEKKILPRSLLFRREGEPLCEPNAVRVSDGASPSQELARFNSK
jgi:hypothetical protein